jgi:hypothetical protein
MYKKGGVYLDIKSTVRRPLDSVIHSADRYILSHWKNRTGDLREDWGCHNELAATGRGEYQQWHIICAAGHPFLKAVIEAVLRNIDDYTPWRQRLGQHAVVRVTGPIAYTLAIHPLLAAHEHSLYDTDEEIGLEYSVLPGFAHSKLFKKHYYLLEEPLVTATGMKRLSTQAFLAVRRVKNMLRALRPTETVSESAPS